MSQHYPIRLARSRKGKLQKGKGSGKGKAPERERLRTGLRLVEALWCREEGTKVRGPDPSGVEKRDGLVCSLVAGQTRGAGLFPRSRAHSRATREWPAAPPETSTKTSSSYGTSSSHHRPSTYSLPQHAHRKPPTIRVACPRLVPREAPTKNLQLR